MPKIIDDGAVYRATMEIVSERGYDGATTRQIAEAAGMSEVTLFRKYGSKAQLVKEAMAALAKQTDFSAAAAYTGDITADLLRVAQAYQGTAGERGQFLYSVLLEFPRHAELAELSDLMLEIISSIGQLLARYQAEGILAAEHPVRAVAGLLGPLIVTNMIRNSRWDLPLPPIDLESHVAHFLEGRRLRPVAPGDGATTSISNRPPEPG